MTAKPKDKYTCEECQTHLGLYLDDFLENGASATIQAHLEECVSCGQLLQQLRESRERLRVAVRSVKAPPVLAMQIRGELRELPKRNYWNFSFTFAMVAAAVILGVFLLNQVVELRLAARAQDAYISWLSNRVESVMRVGLRDHVHCAYFRKFPKTTESIDAVARDLDPSYRDLVPALKENLPQDFHVAMAHQCRYQGRKFIHVVAKREGDLVSLVIAERAEGETFQTSKLLPALSEGGTAIYEAAARDFQIAGFESGRHLVYVISDLSGDTNAAVLQAMAPRVKKVLASLNS